jgi:hypothetical protein
MSELRFKLPKLPVAASRRECASNRGCHELGLTRPDRLTEP